MAMRRSEEGMRIVVEMGTKTGLLTATPPFDVQIVLLQMLQQLPPHQLWRRLHLRISWQPEAQEPLGTLPAPHGEVLHAAPQRL